MAACVTFSDVNPWGHQSLDAIGHAGCAYLDGLASPESDAPSTSGLGVSAEALLQSLPANEAAILRLRVLEGQSLRSVAGELGVSAMTVSRREKAALPWALAPFACSWEP